MTGEEKLQVEAVLGCVRFVGLMYPNNIEMAAQMAADKIWKTSVTDIFRVATEKYVARDISNWLTPEFWLYYNRYIYFNSNKNTF